jgi:hypothetical protein
MVTANASGFRVGHRTILCERNGANVNVIECREKEATTASP